MDEQGPLLETLTRRLTECPGDFLAAPRIGDSGVIHVGAVVADLVRDLGGSFEKNMATPFQLTRPTQSDLAKVQENWLRVVLVVCWLLDDEWFSRTSQFGSLAYTLLANGLMETSRVVQAPKLITEPDRREELARLCLAQLGLRPQNETVAQAEDRLATLSSIGRLKVIQAARKAEQRAQAIREAMKKAAAEEAAAKYTRE